MDKDLSILFKVANKVLKENSRPENIETWANNLSKIIVEIDALEQRRHWAFTQIRRGDMSEYCKCKELVRMNIKKGEWTCGVCLRPLEGEFKVIKKKDIKKHFSKFNWE